MEYREKHMDLRGLGDLDFNITLWIVAEAI